MQFDFFRYSLFLIYFSIDKSKCLRNNIIRNNNLEMQFELFR